MPQSDHSRTAVKALAAVKAKGGRLGTPVRQSAAAREQVRLLRRGGASRRATAMMLTSLGVPTATGARWWASTIRSMEDAERRDLEARRIRLGFRCRLSEDGEQLLAGPPGEPVVVGKIFPEPNLDDLFGVEMTADSGEVMGFSDPGEFLVPAAMFKADIIEWIDLTREGELDQVEERLQGETVW